MEVITCSVVILYQPTWRESLTSLVRSAHHTLLPRRHTQREANWKRVLMWEEPSETENRCENNPNTTPLVRYLIIITFLFPSELHLLLMPQHDWLARLTAPPLRGVFHMAPQRLLLLTALLRVNLCRRMRTRPVSR